MTRETPRGDEAADLLAAVIPARHPGPRVEVVVRGRVRRGIEPHSVVLQASDGRRFQLGEAYSRCTGRMVLVTGQIRQDLFTTAQEGVVLRVDSIQFLDDEAAAPRPT